MPSWLPNFHAPKHMFSFIEGAPNNPRTGWLSRRQFTGRYSGPASVVRRSHPSIPRQPRPPRHVAKEAFYCPTVDSVDEAIQCLHVWTTTIDDWELLSNVYQDYD